VVRPKEVLLKPGMQLYADPRMDDPFFSRALLTVSSFSPTEGAMGFILNRPMDLDLNQLVEERIIDQVPVWYGGPVDNSRLFFMHQAADLIPESTLIQEDVFFGGDFQVLVHALNTGVLTPDRVRFFLGYSGWSKGQLEEEMITGAWVPDYDSLASLFSRNLSGEDWKSKMLSMGNPYALWASFDQQLIKN
jgi:putative transcriptional regulator